MSGWRTWENQSSDTRRRVAKRVLEHEIEALAVQVDPAGRDAWVVTPTETVKLSPKGEVKQRVPHACKTSKAWVAAFD